MLAALREILQPNGIGGPGRAPDGEEALAQIQAFKPAVALVDIGMPRCRGSRSRTAFRRPPDTATHNGAFGYWALLSEALDAGARGFAPRRRR